MRKWILTALLVSLIPSLPGSARPVPGGVNQAAGLSGPRGKWLFNGRYRLRLDSVTDAAREDYADKLIPNPGEKVFLVRMVMKNGQKETNSDVIRLTFSDADGITQSSKDYLVHPNPTPSTIQGGAWKVTAVVAVPQDYSPTKLVVSFPTDLKHPVFRVSPL
jgi:hypothetical protein